MEKYYYELTIQPNLYYELFLDLASSLTNDALEELDETIIIRSEDTLDDVESGILAFAKELSDAFSIEIVCKTVLEKKENQDWIKLYQESVQPIEVDKFYIHPSWCQEKDDKLNIVIDPTLAFGSGHHETTNSCLLSISKYINKDDKACDIGTGSGILGIAAAKMGAIVDICDTDIVAVEDAISNFKANDVLPNNYWEGSANNSSEVYDVVIANIVADVLAMISKDIKKITKDNGIIILSGIMEQHKQKVLNKFLKNEECELIEELQQNEWVTIIIKKVKKANNG
ncbi:MAG: 50S ribosomal protein L11 methyltransferase [Campylobacterota bacterium]|nr:50S ribosomal protein L11 methyltransferase [Campylobacterota bacterium]